MALPPLPSPDVPVVGANGMVNPVWYGWLKVIENGGSTGLPTTGASDGYLLTTSGTVASWAGFLQAGTGAIIRKWRDKIREMVSVTDYGTDSTAFSNALSANSAVHVPAGSYTATVSVGNDKLLTMDSGSLISSLSSSSGGTVAKWNNNPNGLAWGDSPVNGKENKSGLYVDIGGYGPTKFGNVTGLTFGVIGAVNIPSGATQYHASGLAGYAKTSSASTGAVGLYGQGEIQVTSSLAWGINTVSTDNGYQAGQIWGAEIDLNISNVNSVVVGLDVVGGSTVEPAVAIAYRVGALGAFASPPKRWSQGMQFSDGSCVQAMEIGASASSGTNIGGPPIQFIKRNSGGSRAYGGRIYHGGLALNIELDDSSDYLRLKTGSGTIAFQAQGTAIGFYGATLVGKQTLSGSKGGNAALATVCAALANLGLVIDSTT